MALPAAADQVVIQGFLLDEVTAQGDVGQVSSEPVALTGQNTSRPLVLARDSHVMIRTGKRVTTPRQSDGYWALLALSTNDPDLDAYGGRKITLPDGSFRVIQVPYDAPQVTVSAGMAEQVSGLTVGTQVRAVWYDQAAGYVTPTPPAAYYTAVQINSLLADVLAGVPETARDTLGTALVAGSNITITPNDTANTITIASTGGGSSAFLQWAGVVDALIAGTITRNSDGAATSAPVVWPDGAPGTYTATTVSTTFPGAVDAYTVTYGSPVTKTYTQSAVTRNASGAITQRPAITVA